MRKSQKRGKTRKTSSEGKSKTEEKTNKRQEKEKRREGIHGNYMWAGARLAVSESLRNFLFGII